MADVEFARANRWLPRVVRSDDGLALELGAGADANHDPRTFEFPIEDAHLAVIREDLVRHLLLWSAILPLCSAAGTRGPLDEAAAVALLDPILLSTPAQIEALFQSIPWETGQLIAHGADIDLLERGQVFSAMRSATVEADWPRVQEYEAVRRRVRAGVVLSELDTAILRYTGQYLHGGATMPKRVPDAVDPALLPDVAQVIATAEHAAAALRIGRDPRRGRNGWDKRDWDRMMAAVDAAVRQAHPELADEAVRTVSFLMCSEAAGRVKRTPIDGDDEDADDSVGNSVEARSLSFTDDKDVERTWHPGSSRTATADFWDFVADRYAGDNEVFTIEDEAKGEGIQLHFFAESVARITTVAQPADGADPEYRVEYSLVDGMGGYRAVVRAFVRGGCIALDGQGPWMSDAAELERARQQRRADEAAPTREQQPPAPVADVTPDQVRRFARMWADTGYVDPTGAYYVLFDSLTIEEAGEDRDQLLQLVRDLGLEIVDAPSGAATGEVRVRTSPSIDSELENWA